MQARLEQQQADLEAQARRAGSHSALQLAAADAKSRQQRADQAMEILQHELRETRAAVVAAETAQREVRQLIHLGRDPCWAPGGDVPCSMPCWMMAQSL